MVHSYVNSAITMFTLVTVDVNLCHACKKSINNTQNEVKRHPGRDIHEPLTFDVLDRSTFWAATPATATAQYSQTPKKVIPYEAPPISGGVSVLV